VQQLIPGPEQADHGTVGRDHDLYLGPRFTLAVGVRLALGFTLGRFTRLAVAAGTALAAQVVV